MCTTDADVTATREDTTQQHNMDVVYRTLTISGQLMSVSQLGQQHVYWTYNISTQPRVNTVQRQLNVSRLTV